MLVEELLEKLSFCEPDEEIKIVLLDKGKYLTVEIDDLEVYDEFIAVFGEGGEE